MSGAERPEETVLWRAVFDSVGAGVLVTDTTGRVTDVNPFARRALAWSAEDLLGRDLHDRIHRRPDGSRAPRRGCRSLAVLDTREPAEGSDGFYLRGDDTLMPVIWATAPLRYEGRMEGLVIVFHRLEVHHEGVERTAANLAALEELNARLSMVAEVSALLISTPDTAEMLDKLVGLLVPEAGDWAAVDLCPAGGTERMRRAAVEAHHDHGAAQALKGPLPPLPRDSGTALARALHDLEPVLMNAPDLAREPIARAHRHLFDRLGGHCAVVVPLYTRRELFGALTVARTGNEPAYTTAEFLALKDIAQRVSLMMESNQLLAQQRHMAETMQRQLLTPLPQVNHLRFAARYRPAERLAEVGGDWYDAFLLNDGIMTMVIGDVVGHDLQAAAHMAEVRNMLRALAWDRQEPPSVIMRRLDEAMTNTSDAPMATVVFARVEGPEGGPWTLHWVNAGHPPPLLVTADGRARYLEDGHGPLLGMSSALHMGLRWPDASERLPARSTLLFYTDGLVESRHQRIDTGMDDLRRHACALVGRDLEEFLDELLVRIGPSGDDVALLALRLPPAGAGTGEDTAPPPPQHAHSPAAAQRKAPGSRVEDAPLRDTSEPE